MLALILGFLNRYKTQIGIYLAGVLSTLALGLLLYHPAPKTAEVVKEQVKYIDRVTVEYRDRVVTQTITTTKTTEKPSGERTTEVMVAKTDTKEATQTADKINMKEESRQTTIVTTFKPQWRLGVSLQARPSEVRDSTVDYREALRITAAARVTSSLPVFLELGWAPYTNQVSLGLSLEF